MDALFARAARLRKVDFVEPESVIGKNTVASLQSGLVYGFAGQVDGIVEGIRRELGVDARVVATGGLAELDRKEHTSELQSPMYPLLPYTTLFRSDGRAVRACGTAAQGRLRRAGVRDRQEHRRQLAVGPRVWVRRPGGRHRRRNPARARR